MLYSWESALFSGRFVMSPRFFWSMGTLLYFLLCEEFEFVDIGLWFRREDCPPLKFPPKVIEVA